MVEGNRREKYIVDIKAGIHPLIADILPSNGGSDLGPNPHELVEAALTACTILTVQKYADTKGWNLKSTHVKVVIDKEGSESHITRNVSFSGELSEEQRTRLFEIANKCPIHRLLTSQIKIDTIMD